MTIKEFQTRLTTLSTEQFNLLQRKFELEAERAMTPKQFHQCKRVIRKEVNRRIFGDLSNLTA